MVLMVTLGCSSTTSPSGSLTGTWQARGIGHGLLFEMTLQQSGSRVTGSACGVSDGVVMFRNATVSGDAPQVRFTVTPDSAQPCCAHLAGSSFTGRLDGTGDIVGSSSFGSDLRFERSTAWICPAGAVTPTSGPT